jgi:CRP-like cAMP-binding protein
VNFILEKYINTLINCSLFKNINKEELLKILSCMKPKITNYTTSDIAISSDTKLKDIYIVLYGIVEISKESANGNKVIINKCYKGDVFGEVIALSSNYDSNIVITAINPSIILSLNTDIIKNTCQNCCNGHNTLISNIIEELANKAMFLNLKIQYLSIKSMRSKLCTFLYNTYTKSGKFKFSIKFNRNELADFLNVSRPSMSRELGRLKNENILDFKGNIFEILNVKELIRYIE